MRWFFYRMFSCSIEVQRQCNSKSRTFTLPAGYGNRTAFIIDDIFDDGKSQSGTFDMLADDVAAAEKRIE